MPEIRTKIPREVGVQVCVIPFLAHFTDMFFTEKAAERIMDTKPLKRRLFCAKGEKNRPVGRRENQRGRWPRFLCGRLCAGSIYRI